MKASVIVVLGILFLVSQVGAQEKLVLKNQKEKVSYIIGMDIGGNLKKQSIDIDPNILLEGIQVGLAGAKSLLADQEIQETMVAFKREMVAKQVEIAKKNKVMERPSLLRTRRKKALKPYRAVCSIR